jgi:hypothetical protein
MMGYTVRIIAAAGIALIALPAGGLSAADIGKTRLSQSTGHASEVTPDAPAGAAKEGTPATVIDDREVEGILGKSVRSSADEDMGRIIDILVNRAGQVRAAVIDFGGFLGVGSRKIAVDWSALHFPESGKFNRITLDLTRNQVRLAPEYRRGEPVVVLGSSDATQPTPNAVSPRSEK